MNRRQRIHEEILTEENNCRKLQTNEITKPSTNSTANIRNIAEILQKNTMENSMKVVVRRTVMTRRGWKFPPREPVVLNLVLSSAAKSGEQETREGFLTLLERVKAAFPKLQEKFTLLRKGDDGELVPCNNQEELQKAIDEAHEGTMQMFVQGPCKWQNRTEDVQVHCTNCGTCFQGTRTKCLECSDFNLCPECDEKGVHGIHVKALPLFTESLPKLCQEVRERTQGETMPRLGPKDIRQVWQKERKLRDEKMDCDAGTGTKRKSVNRPKPGNKKQICERPQQDVQCSHCTGEIRGTRVKCLECEDVDICHQCDQQGIHDSHIMVKCDRPQFFKHALPMFVEVIPKLCDEVKGRTHGESYPRVEPSELRQFWKKERNQKDICFSEANECDKSDHGVSCSNCEVSIQAMRLKCLECEDFNLCETCDGQGVHTEHVMVKSDKPRFFNHGLRHFGDILPKLIEEFKKNDDHTPRLEREDVRQFWQKNRKGEQKKKCEGRRQHMRKMWHMFLQDIAARGESVAECEMVLEDDGTGDKTEQPSSDDEVLTDKVQNLDLGEKANKASTKHRPGDKVHQMKRQWMQKCLREWRQKMQTERESEEPSRKLAFKLWRPYMKGCWDSWKDQTAEHGMKVGAHHTGRHQKPCHSRRRWIQKSWKQWCQEADKVEKDCSPSNTTCPDDVSEGRTNRGAFPGFHTLMRDSWKMMQEHTEYQNLSNDENISENDLADDGEVNDFDPKKAQQILKKCWVDGCRELWWMQTRSLMDSPEVDSEEKEESEVLSQDEMMEMMSAKPSWRSYMQQIWRLWKQLSRQAGLCDGGSTVESAIDESDGGGTATTHHPRKIWIESCWPLWNDEMKNLGNHESASSTNEASVPKWNRRPFAGWHSLLIRSWKMMIADEKESADTRLATIRSMRAAWLKEVEKETQKLPLKQDSDCPDEAVSSVEEASTTKNTRCTKETTRPNPQWERYTQLKRKLMHQYWQMCKTQKNSQEEATHVSSRSHGVNRRQRKWDRMQHTACADYRDHDGCRC